MSFAVPPEGALEPSAPAIKTDQQAFDALFLEAVRKRQPEVVKAVVGYGA